MNVLKNKYLIFLCTYELNNLTWGTFVHICNLMKMSEIEAKITSMYCWDDSFAVDIIHQVWDVCYLYFHLLIMNSRTSE